MVNEDDNIGGWPKIINEEPERPHDIFADESNETDEPHDINRSLESDYFNTENVYFVIKAFESFVSLGIYPPKWALEELARRFKKHMANPDPQLLASQLGVSARGSGSTNPHDEYKWWVERFEVIGDMSILVSGFDISLIDAARAMVEKRQLSISPKTLLNDFRYFFGDTQRIRYKNRDWGPFFDEEGRDGYISEFPRRALRFIKDKKPRIKLGDIENNSPTKR